MSGGDLHKEMKTYNVVILDWVKLSLTSPPTPMVRRYYITGGLLLSLEVECVLGQDSLKCVPAPTAYKDVCQA